jgi:hypothetical protein
MPAVASEGAGPGWLHEIKHDGFRIFARPGQFRGLTTTISETPIEQIFA